MIRASIGHDRAGHRVHLEAAAAAALRALPWLAFGGMLAAPAAAAAQDGAAPSVRWEPETPVQGTLFRVQIDAAGEVESATGTAAGEPLHFVRAGDGVLTALAPAPLDQGATLELRVEVRRPDGSTAPVLAEVPVAEGSYAVERLTVAPELASPDAETQARIDREEARAIEVSRRAHTTPRLWDRIVRPRDSQVTSGFGSGRILNDQVHNRHTGTDFAGTVGDPVNAAARGVVALVDEFFIAGKVIYIDHGEGVVTAYYHLSETLVGQGDDVDAGQTIGRVGATGRVTGPHLHWAVRYGAISVDPMSLLAVAGR